MPWGLSGPLGPRDALGPQDCRLLLSRPFPCYQRAALMRAACGRPRPAFLAVAMTSGW